MYMCNMYQMSAQFNHELSLSGKIPSGFFTSMLGYKGYWQKGATNTKKLAFAGWFITLYNIELAKAQISLSEKVKQEVPASWDPTALAVFVDKYGTHIVVGVKMGGNTYEGSTRAHSYYNLPRSYHSKGDYEKAGLYYMASVKEVNKPQEFILPFYGLGHVQLKLGDFKSSLSNFEKVLEVYHCDTLKVVAHIHLQLNLTTKAHEPLKKAVRIDPRDPE